MTVTEIRVSPLGQIRLIGHKPCCGMTSMVSHEKLSDLMDRYPLVPVLPELNLTGQGVPLTPAAGRPVGAFCAIR